MKTLSLSLLFILLLSTDVFPQVKIHPGVLSENITTERLRAIQENNLDGLLKPNIYEMRTSLRSQQRASYSKKTLIPSGSRTTLSKTLLGNGYLLTNYVYKVWNGSDWVNYSKLLITYDGKNNLLDSLVQLWDVSNWNNYYKWSYTYDQNNNRTSYMRQTWDGIKWSNNSNYKYTYTYDVNNDSIEALYQIWNGNDSNWVNYSKNSYTYDVNKNIIETLGQNWSGSDWVNYFIYTYTYDVNNNRTGFLSQTWEGSNWFNKDKYSYTYDEYNNLTGSLYQNWNGTFWVNNGKSTYTYDVNNNLTEDLLQTFNVFDSIWTNYQFHTYDYDVNNKMVEQLLQNWDELNLIWVNYWQYLYTYNGINNIQSLWQLWDAANWVNYYRWSYTYDVNNNLTEQIKQNWDRPNSSWFNIYDILYNYTPVTGIDDENKFTPTEFTLSQNYPNPFNPSTKIKYSVPQSSKVLVKIFDVLGKEIETLVNEEKTAGSYELTWHAENLPSGVYFYRLQTGSFVETKKMLLMK